MDRAETMPDVMFSGKLRFLSNMYPCAVRICVQGTEYVFQSAEAAYQAGKCADPKNVPLFAGAVTGPAAKKLGRKVGLRPDWEEQKVPWMAQVLEAKFTQNPELMERLVGTYPMELHETNTWKDAFWGIYQGQGKDMLGKLLTDIRERYR